MLQRDQINEQSFKTLLASARIILHAQNGSLSEQLKKLNESDFDLITRNSHQGSYYKLNEKRRQITTQTEKNLFSSIDLISQQKPFPFSVNGEDLQY
ncbi:hypothetical protein, partial [Bartonella sp. MR168JLCBS]